MIFRKIYEESELLEFIAKFRENSGGVEFPLSYLKSSEVMAGFCEKDSMVCGYVFAYGKNMRWPGLLPMGAKSSLQEPFEQVMELNGIWLAPTFRRGPEAAKLWIQVSKHVGHQKASCITFAVDARKEGLIRLYRPIISGKVYEGPVTVTSVPNAIVFYSRKWRFKFLWYFYALGLLKRYFYWALWRERGKKTQKINSPFPPR